MAHRAAGRSQRRPRTLRVYHTPEMQKLVADLVDRFVSSEAATYTFSLRVVTLDSPSWRTAAQRLLRPVPVQTPGVNAWLLAKEDAAILVGELRRRNDYREHSSPYLMVNNGQSTVVSSMRGRPYVRDVILPPQHGRRLRADAGPGRRRLHLDFSPLLSADRRMIDATIKCDIDQVEKMIPVMIDVPTADSPRQRTQDRGAADHALSLPRASSLAGRPGAGGGHGHGGAADPGRRQAAAAGRAAALRQHARPRRSADSGRVQGSSARGRRQHAVSPFTAKQGHELPRAVLKKSPLLHLQFAISGLDPCLTQEPKKRGDAEQGEDGDVQHGEEIVNPKQRGAAGNDSSHAIRAVLPSRQEQRPSQNPIVHVQPRRQNPTADKGEAQSDDC